MTYETAQTEYSQARFAFDWAQGVLFMAQDTLPAHCEQMYSIERDFATIDRAYDAAREELDWYGENESYYSDEMEENRRAA